MRYILTIICFLSFAPTLSFAVDVAIEKESVGSSPIEANTQAPVKHPAAFWTDSLPHKLFDPTLTHANRSQIINTQNSNGAINDINSERGLGILLLFAAGIGLMIFARHVRLANRKRKYQLTAK